MLGNYNLKDYSRGRILYKGLKKNKVHTSIFLIKKNKYLNLIKRILKKDYDILLVTGKPILLLSWILKPIHRKKIIFDMFISDYDNLVNDRKIIKQNSIKAKLIWAIDKYSCKLANKIILDTNEHINYFIKEFNVNNKKFERVFIGADEEIFHTKKVIKSKKQFTILFHGTFIPLQGIEYIIKSAKLLEQEKEIKFKIIGNGQTFEKIQKLSFKLNSKNIEFMNFIKIDKLPKLISESDICLGIFGNTEKAKKVIPNKAYEIIAMQKPLITTNTIAIKELFTNEKDCLLCKISDEQSIVNAIKKLKNNKGLRKKISKNGYELFKKQCNTIMIGKVIKKIIKKELH